MNWGLSYALVLLGELLFIAALLHMLYRRRSPSNMIAWLLGIFLLPYIAVPLYFIVGTRKREKKLYKRPFSMRELHKSTCENSHPVDAVLRNNGIPSMTGGNGFELHSDGVSAYRVLIEEVHRARESIYIGTYIFKNDATGRALLEALTQKAREGVRVKLLIDSLGSFRLYLFQSPFRALREAGGEVCFFMPVLHIPFRNYINLRNHRKIYLFDARCVLTGGMNISIEYLGSDARALHWNDLLFLIRGPAVFHYFEIFASDWNYASGKPLPEKEYAVPDPEGGSVVQVVPSGPDIAADALFEALISAIHAAQKRIWIVTPYFVPDEAVVQALVIASRKGVDVRLITPRESDHYIADLGRSSYMRELEESGITVALYGKSMLHAKAVLFDETIAMLGSVNIDNRSLFLNYEVVSFAYSADVIGSVEAWMKTLLAHSGKGMEPAGRIRRLGENFMRVIASQL